MRLNLRFLNSVVVILIILATTATFLILESFQIQQNDVPRGDEAAFLETAISIREYGGPLTLIPRMFSGEYREANRHPLYVLLLSPIAQRDLAFYSQAKIITAALSLIFILLVLSLLSKQVGIDVALVITYLFATNLFFLEHSAKISTEPLLMNILLVSWYLIVKNFYKTYKSSFQQGGASSLAYLSKVTAIFIIPAYFLTVLFTKGRGILSRHVLYFIFGFILVSLPLLWRNTVAFGNPLYNYNSKLLWIQSGAERRTVTLYEGESRGFLSFVREQAPKDLMIRVVDGLAGEAVVITQVVAFSYARIRGAILLALLFVIALFKDKKKQRALFSAFIVLAFYLFFSWYYKISGHYRYILPVVFIFFFYIVGYLYQLLKKLLLKFMDEKTFSLFFKVSLLSVCVLTFLKAYNTYGFVSPVGAVNPPSDYLEVKNWVQENIGNDRYLNGPGHDYQVEWLTGTDFQRFEMPVTSDYGELQRFIKDWDILYVILSRPTVSGREDSIGDFFKNESDIGINIIKEPPGWELVLKDTGEKTKFLIYKIVDEE